MGIFVTDPMTDLMIDPMTIAKNNHLTDSIKNDLQV